MIDDELINAFAADEDENPIDAPPAVPVEPEEEEGEEEGGEGEEEEEENEDEDEDGERGEEVLEAAGDLAFPENRQAPADPMQVQNLENVRNNNNNINNIPNNAIADANIGADNIPDDRGNGFVVFQYFSF